MFGNCWPRGIILGVCECVSECLCGVVCVEMGWQGGNVWELLA